MSEENAAYIIKQLISAIMYCHSKEVVHRDLKPENILIDSIAVDGKIDIKIIDFGTALFFSPQEIISETLGTVYYMAPEVLMENYNEKCDIWSIGVILFILLCGNFPFGGEADSEVIASIKLGTYSFDSICGNYLGNIWDGVSVTAKDLIEKMLTYDPAKRISAVEAYKHPWLKKKGFSSLNEEQKIELSTNIHEFYVFFK